MLRVVNRFQRIVGFDRAMALASTALTAAIALAILLGPLLGRLGEKDAADRIIDRYGLTGGGAEAVRQIFVAGEQTGTNLLGAIFLLISVLSFSRGAQRFFEQTWELKPLSVRNTVNGLLWIAVLAGFATAAGWVRALISGADAVAVAAVATAPLTLVFLVVTGLLLSDRRIPWTELLPFAFAASVAETVYSVAAAVYLPRYFSASASRYGPIGAVFAMISTLFVVMLIVVAAGALGREVDLELARIRRGEAPPEGEVRREWRNLREQALLRWDVLRERLRRRRDRRPPDPD